MAASIVQDVFVITYYHPSLPPPDRAVAAAVIAWPQRAATVLVATEQGRWTVRCAGSPTVSRHDTYRAALRAAHAAAYLYATDVGAARE